VTDRELRNVTGHDPVHRPDHYRWLPGDLEVIDITEGMSFCHGNVVKYVLRADHKGSPIEDLRKAAWYLAREIERREAASIDPLMIWETPPAGCICALPTAPGSGVHCDDCPRVNA
jgi:uncharacterized protein DUF3310